MSCVLVPGVLKLALLMLRRSFACALLKWRGCRISIASTHPHHKHVPPDITRKRIPDPALSFTRPNLPLLIEEIERELLG